MERMSLRMFLWISIKKIDSSVKASQTDMIFWGNVYENYHFLLALRLNCTTSTISPWQTNDGF